MTRRPPASALACLLLATLAGVALAQRFGGGGRRPPPGPISDDRRGVPDWKVDERFKNDVFTFVRIEYDSGGGGGGRGRRGGGFGGGYGGGRWAIDYPDSDLNFSYRLQQLTALKVNPQPITMRLTDDRLVRLPVHLHHRAGRPGLLRGGGHRPPPLPR